MSSLEHYGYYIAFSAWLIPECHASACYPHWYYRRDDKARLVRTHYWYIHIFTGQLSGLAARQKRSRVTSIRTRVSYRPLYGCLLVIYRQSAFRKFHYTNEPCIRRAVDIYAMQCTNIFTLRRYFILLHYWYEFWFLLYFIGLHIGRRCLASHVPPPQSDYIIAWFRTMHSTLILYIWPYHKNAQNFSFDDDIGFLCFSHWYWCDRWLDDMD